ncbi:SDR family oxidoreductase [Pseudemcibacter aquimaris]|uniref:SDR family oxidoreductase n=1 Tax=Pseudemcibacter aquimaris TaxID=2857064 RepID=UPI0020120BBB|nr:SDR family oxidoreductase [Pseudemcibacter aquimaris]MCC3862580.1 SDR family oxidoreductase [Pseudemcibacter aquimaris]WDU57902.1 SDR family oxidoreductase [Pseudemcibacter aquimaris]
MSSNKTVVITGANRGIGLSIAQHFHNDGYNIIGICRNSSDELDQIATRVVDGIDVSTAEGCEKLGQELSGTSIDILVNNAGILSEDVFGNLDFDTMEKQFRVNSLGVLRVTEALRNRLSDGSKIAIITSRMGSIADNTSGGRYGYRMSKAAVNAAGMSLCHDLKPLGIAVGLFHPGYVMTGMTSGRGEITPDVSAGRLKGLIEKLDIENSGSFWHSNGEILPW